MSECSYGTARPGIACGIAPQGPSGVSYRWPGARLLPPGLRPPWRLAFSATGLVARLPISMMTLGIVLLVSTLTGSYALAGQVSAAYIIGNAAFAVPHGRLADRFGQGPVLYVDSVVFALTSGLMIVSVTDDWATAPAPCPGRPRRCRDPADRLDGPRSLGAPAPDGRERHTAFAVEGVADEVVFVTGPRW